MFRRVLDHVRSQNWLAVGIDFVIVVVGVFIGIQVSNWNEARVNRDAEAAYLELLQQDLRASIVEVESQIEFEQFMVEIGNGVLPLIDGQPSELRRRKIGMTLDQLGARRTLIIESPTFLDLQSSGRLGLISNPDLRRAIVSYFFGIKRLEAVIDKNNATFIDDGFNRFTDDISVGSWVWDTEIMGMAAPAVFDTINQTRRERIDPSLMATGGSVLMLPASADVWSDVKSRVGKRSGVAAANEAIANRLRSETVELESRIEAYLGGADQ
nr:DUF6090 family protein [Parvularcula mediterranea]